MVLGAYAQALVAGKRVAVLGDSSTGLGTQLAEASGRRVHVYDPDPRRTAASLGRVRDVSSSAVSYAVLDQEAELRREAFDVVVVPDLGAFSSRARAIRHAATLVTAVGLVIVASRNPDALDANANANANDARDRARGAKPLQPSSGASPGLSYLDFYDLVTADLPTVRMLGQAPFLGYTVADFAAEGEPAVTIDTSLVEHTEEPQWFIAVASKRPVKVDPYTLVQVPLQDALGWLDLGSAEAARPGLEAELEEARKRSAALSAELERGRERQKRDAELSEQRRVAAAAAAAKATEVERQLARSAQHEAELGRTLREVEAREVDLEAALTASVEREAELEEALSAARAAQPAEPPRPAEPDAATPVPSTTVRGYEFQLAELRKSLFAARNERDLAREAALELPALRAELEQTARAWREAEGRAAELEEALCDPEVAAAQAREISALEQGLRERGQRVTELESELREAKKVGQELVRELGRARPVAAADVDRTSGGESPALSDTASATPGWSSPAAPGGVGTAAPNASDSPQTPGQLGQTVDAQQLELIVQKCSAFQADLEAARWTIASLRQQLEESKVPQEVPDHQKLEEALRAAQLELARLRAGVNEPPGSSEPPASPKPSEQR